MSAKANGQEGLDSRNDVVTDEKLDKYFDVTRRALEAVAAASWDESRRDLGEDFLDMAKRYFSDAKHFREKGDCVLAFGALNYAHAWLDAGARAGLFLVSDDSLFAADPK
ncbi:DUF357 domain-containing protein [Candidatus Woesearchaeota archaeon]|nr:DUF357 domain-containing protein [Candidatus Woesearchaeota archaeon]